MLTEVLTHNHALVGKGASLAEVKDAEKALGTCFSEEYKDYLLKYGTAACNGHEFTGISSSERVNVVDVTIFARENNPNVSSNMYVIEQTNIDGIVMWQDEEGVVYSTHNSDRPKVVAISIGAFLKEDNIDESN